MAKNSLTEYSAKRTFTATPEPPGAVRSAASGPLLFVVQQHSARRLHYDFRLECDGVLKSWAVPSGPALDPNEKRLAVQTEDHPYDYASFEGVIPPGQYGAGEVIVWDCGVYSPDEGGATWFHDRAAAEREVLEGLAKGKLSMLLRGEKLKGSFALVRTKEAKQWLLLKHKDRFAVPRRRHCAEPVGPLRDGRRGSQGHAGAEDARGAARPVGQSHADAFEALADARRNRRRAVQSSRLDVGTQARRLSRPRVHRRARRQAPLAARARARADVSHSSPSSPSRPPTG